MLNKQIWTPSWRAWPVQSEPFCHTTPQISKCYPVTFQCCGLTVSPKTLIHEKRKSLKLGHWVGLYTWFLLPCCNASRKPSIVSIMILSFQLPEPWTKQNPVFTHSQVFCQGDRKDRSRRWDVSKGQGPAYYFLTSFYLTCFQFSLFSFFFLFLFIYLIVCLRVSL